MLVMVMGIAKCVLLAGVATCARRPMCVFARCTACAMQARFARCAKWRSGPGPILLRSCARTLKSTRAIFFTSHPSPERYLAALARSRSGVRGRGAVLREFHGLDHEVLGPTLTPGQAATSSRLLFDLRPVPPRETRCASAPIPRKRSSCPGPAQGPRAARSGPIYFYGTARRIFESQGFGVLTLLNPENQGLGGPCCKN